MHATHVNLTSMYTSAEVLDSTLDGRLDFNRWPNLTMKNIAYDFVAIGIDLKKIVPISPYHIFDLSLN